MNDNTQTICPQYEMLDTLAFAIKLGPCLTTFGGVIVAMEAMGRSGSIALLAVLWAIVYPVLIYAAGEALSAFRDLVRNSHRQAAAAETAVQMQSNQPGK